MLINDNTSAISITQKALDSNELLRRLFTNYDEKSKPFKTVLLCIMNKNKCDEVNAAYYVIKKANQDKIENEDSFQLWVLSSMVDIFNERKTS
jgi:hypothetical protein